ncbi:MAG: retropepsin-like domain-containing protein [Planctomycetaceae bacterium]|nr:retropepsin-like domain-containing protein [Planctomycetaceae bacterium]
MRLSTLTLAALLLAGCGGGSAGRRSAPADATTDAALEASAKGDLDAAEAMLRDSRDPDAQRLRARFLLMKNRNREAIDVLSPLKSQKVNDFEGAERWQRVLPDLALAYVRLDDFMNATSIARSMGDAVLARKYQALSRTVAYSSNLGTDEIGVEFYITDPLPVVAGSVGGVRALFVVDTLLDEVVLDRDLARRAGITGIGGGDEAVLPELSLGKLTVKNLPVHLGQAMRIGDLKPEGAIGLQFLMHYDFTLDYRRSRLLFRRAGGPMTAGQPALIAGDRYLLLQGLMNGKDRTFVGIGSSLKGVTLAVSDLFSEPAGGPLNELAAGGLKLSKPSLDPKAFPAGLDGSFGVPVGFVLGHAALRGRTLRLEPRSMKLSID